MIKTNTWINTILKILSKNNFLSKEYGSRTLQTKAPSGGPHNILTQRSGLTRICPFLSWRHYCGAVQYPARGGGYSCSSHFQHHQLSNFHCWDQESSQIAMVTYPLMLWGSATAKHWPTDTWYSHLFFWKNKKHIICILMLMFKHILLI